MISKKKSYLVPLFGFAFIILISAILLYLPITNNKAISFKDALYTAISGVTCTGLLKVNIYNQFNFLGQLVLAISMEIGALGFVIFIAYVWTIMGKKMKMSDIIMINDNISGDSYSAIKEYSVFIINLIMKVQIIGVIFLCVKFIPDLGVLKGIWYSIFYTISAFSNTGFDLTSGNSLLQYKNDIYLQVILIILMILGSIGIFALQDLYINKFKNFKKLKLQSKIILTYSIFVIIVPVFLLKFLEPNISLLNCLFMSATSRSTGFSIANLQEFSTISKVILIVLMIIGGSPASTAGGVRIVSIAIILSTMVSTLKGNDETIMFWRKIPNSLVRKAFTIFMLFLIILFISTMVFSYYSDENLLDIVFDSVSAITTTGLTILQNQPVAGDIILMALMFIGRVGPLSMILAFTRNNEKSKFIQYPEEIVIL